jgi:homoserine O-acetyltransferase/O-succinyltransferase
MKTRTCPATAGSPHVEAFRSTGSSPGRSSDGSPGRTGHVRVALPNPDAAPLEVEVGYEVHGPVDAPAVVVLGGISAGRHLMPTAVDPGPGWWPGVVGPGAALDPAREQLVGVDYVRALDSPTPDSPTSGGPSLDRPISTGDQATVIAAVLDELGHRHATLVGASYGGMVALAFAARFPERTRRLVVFCAAHRTHPMATALRSIQRRTVRLAMEGGRVHAGLGLARALAMTTYRSATEFEARFSHEPGPGQGPIDGPTRQQLQGASHFPVEAYLDARGRAFAARFDASEFLTLSESVDLHAVDPSVLSTPMTVVSVDSDALVPPWLVAELADAVEGPVTHVRLTSIYGHDAFLKETATVATVLRSALGATEVAL